GNIKRYISKCEDLLVREKDKFIDKDLQHFKDSVELLNSKIRDCNDEDCIRELLFKATDLYNKIEEYPIIYAERQYDSLSYLIDEFDWLITNNNIHRLAELRVELKSAISTKNIQDVLAKKKAVDSLMSILMEETLLGYIIHSFSAIGFMRKYGEFCKAEEYWNVLNKLIEALKKNDKGAKKALNKFCEKLFEEVSKTHVY
ncbi:MAG: hypothetical protein ACE5HI_04450, partial [bacterium]